jgi:hypothetical protein
VGSVTSHHAVDSAGGETRHRVYPLWFIAPFLLGHSYGGLNNGPLRRVSSPQSPITVRDALSPRPLAPTRYVPLVGGAKPYELELGPVDGQVAEWRLNKE